MSLLRPSHVAKIGQIILYPSNSIYLFSLTKRNIEKASRTFFSPSSADGQDAACFIVSANANPGNRVQQPLPVLRLKACAHLSTTKIFKIVISSDSSFDWLYGDIYSCIVLLKVIRVQDISQKTPSEGLR